MISFKTYTKSMLLVFCALFAMSLTSCKDQPNEYEIQDGTPKVNYIRALSSEIKGNNDAEGTHYTNGELVEEASPQSVLCLVGENLRSVVDIWFNDRQCVLNTSYITDNTLIVSVPKNVPETVTDKIYLYNNKKEVVEVPFHVVIPAPQVTTMGCEYDQPGTETKIIGQYLVDNADKPLQIFFKDEAGNNIPAKIKNVSPDYTYATVIIPENAKEGSITATSIYGTGVSGFHYLESRGLLFDFDGGGVPVEITDNKVNHGWHGTRCFNDDKSLDGYYIQLGGDGAEMSADGGWDDTNFTFEHWCGSWDDPQNFTSGSGMALTNLVDFSKPENLTLKFEMMIPKDSPWKAGAMQIIFAGKDYVTLSGNGGWKGANNVFFRCPGMDGGDWEKDDYFKDMKPLSRALYRPWKETGSFDTGGKWITVSIPITTSFVYSFDGSALPFNLKPESFSSLTLFVVGGGVNGEDCTPVICVDNIRVVPSK